MIRLWGVPQALRRSVVEERNKTAFFKGLCFLKAELEDKLIMQHCGMKLKLIFVN
tara:strand:- start:182 stop:346 length:165 start_codon:yes stop_codon:yes gene_type:complete